MFNTLMKSFKYLKKDIYLYFFSIIMMSSTLAYIDIIGSTIINDIMTAITLNDYSNLANKLVFKAILGFITLLLWVLFTGSYMSTGKKATANVQNEVFSKALRLPITYYEKNSYSDILTKLTFSTTKACDIYGSKIRRIFHPFISVVAYLIPMMIFNYKLTLLLLLANSILLFFSILFSKPIREINKKVINIMAQETKSFTNSINGYKTIKMYFIEKDIIDKYELIIKKWYKTISEYRLVSSILSSLNSGFDLICSIFFLAIGIKFLELGQITIGELTAIYVLYSQFRVSFLQLGINIPELTGCLVYMQDVLDFLDLPEEDKGEKINQKINNEYKVEFKNVCFSYDDKRILNKFNATFENGKISVLTGNSGCGKSTLLKLLQGYYEIESGEILINGIDIREIGIYNARDLIAYVPQQPYLFSTTIAENINIGKKDASKLEIIEASIRANAHEFIEMKTESYDTRIEEDGKSLSGGERQRIAIARAIIKDAPIVLLDEATAALDNNSEILFQQSIKELMKNKTVIMVAHKPETIAFADIEVKMS